MDALDLWHLVIEVFHSPPNQISNPKGQVQGKLCPKTMAKRMQVQDEENRIVAKSKTTMNLVSLVSTSSQIVNHPVASDLQGNMTRGQEEKENPTQRRVLKEG